MKQKRLVECASIGVHLLEDVARKVDALKSKLSKDCTYRRKGSVPEVAELVQGERADISMVSVESVDREGDVVLSKGMNLDMFQLNPIVTFAHKYDELPVGRCAWIKKVSRGLRAKTIYSEATDIAKACYAMCVEGILKGKSIGFLPTEIRSPTKEEVARNPEWKSANSIIETAILLEYAVAPIPVNQDALVEAVSKGLTDRATLRKLGFPMPPARKLSEQEVAQIVEREFAKHAERLSPAKIRQALLDTYGV